MVCVKRDPAIGTRLDQCSVAHERSIHATSTFLVESTALLFHDGLAAMATAAQRPQVAHQVRSACRLWHDVVDVCLTPSDNTATLLALPVVNTQPLRSSKLPCPLAVAGPRLIPADAAPLTRPAVDPRRPKRRYAVGHQPLARMVAVSPLAAVLFSTSLMNGAANTSSGMAYTRASAVLAASVIFTAAPSLS